MVPEAPQNPSTIQFSQLQFVHGIFRYAAQYLAESFSSTLKLACCIFRVAAQIRLQHLSLRGSYLFVDCH